jgi:glucose-1-phosphate thymidylyltransferase
MKGIVLAGGTGSRLWPITRATSKQLLPVYDKPMIYYPISTLMLAGIREILIITTPHDSSAFQQLLGDGSAFGVRFVYEVQEEPRGLAEAFVIGEAFLRDSSCMMVLGDNIFHGVGLGHQLSGLGTKQGGHIFTYEVADPSQYGILTLNEAGEPASIVEKPLESKSNLAVTGLYVFDSDVPNIAKNVTPSKRGELEITSVIDHYLQAKSLGVTKLSRGTAWLDTGNPESMHDAGTYIRVLEERTGLKIACLEEIAYESGWITHEELLQRISIFKGNAYGKYLQNVAAR